MGIPAINSLANMEYMLYGGNSGNRADCPSIYNGYAAMPQMYDNLQNPYNLFGYNPAFYGSNETPYNDSFESGEQGSEQTNQNGQTFGANPEDIKTLTDYYLSDNTPSSSLIGAAFGGVAFSAMNNPRLIAHPWNYYKATGATNKIFEDVKKEGSKLCNLWKSEKTTGIMQEAYARTHKLEALNPNLGWKFGLFRKPLPEAEYNRLKAVMESALKSGKIEEIAKATEEIKRATNAFTGYIPKGLRAIGLQRPMTSIRKLINGDHYKPIKDIYTKNIGENAKLIGETGKLSLKKSLAKSCGIKNGLFFAGMEFLMGWDNIKEAFSKDTATGLTQVGQTAVKGIGNAAGWAIGEGVGAWAGAKLGAALGSTVAPGIGTVVGAVAGLVGGSIGMWLMGKVTHKITGTDVGEKVRTEKLAQTPQGQVQLLNLTMQKAQETNKLDQRTAQAMQNVINVYS